MDISGEHRIAAAREAVWKALNDPEVLERCIPGCESLQRVADNEYRAAVMAAVGPVKSRFDTQLTLENLNPPESYRIAGGAKAGAAGFGRGHADVRLKEEGGETVLAYDAEFKVGGRLAQVGSRLVLGATRKTADEFFTRFARELDPHRPAEPPPEAETATAPGSRRALYAAAAGVAVLVLLWLLFG